jgi:hypothetical protein
MIWKLPSIQAALVPVIFNPTYFDYLWLGDIQGNYMMNSLGDGRKITIIGKDWVSNPDPTSNIIPGSSTCRLNLDHDADYILDDCTDYLWFECLTGIQRNTTPLELISDNYRTLVKYRETPPFDISAIGLLKDSVILTDAIIDEISEDFRLWILWSQIWNDNGFIKNNRSMYLSSIVAIGSGTLTPRLPNDAPSGLTATPVTSSRIDLAWTNPAGTYSGIRVYRSVDNVNFTLIDTIAYVTSYSATSLTSATHYYFKVQAFSGLFTTIYSNTADSYPMLLTPTGLTLTLLHGGIRVSWTPGLVADNVEVYGKSDSGSYSLLGTITTGTIQYEDFLTSVDLRYYRLRAINGTRYSVYCTEQSVAMLGAELVTQNAWYTAGYWDVNFSACFTQSGTHIVSDGNNGYMQKAGIFVANHQFKCSRTTTLASGYYMPPNDNAVTPPGSWSDAIGENSYLYTPNSPYLRIESLAWAGTLTGLSIKENLAFLIAPSGLTVGWENDYAVMDFVDNSGGVLQHEVYEAEGAGSYVLVTTLAAGVTHYHNSTSQGIMMHYRVRAILGSIASGYSNVVNYETPLVFQTDQSPVSAQLDLYLENHAYYGGSTVTIDWGDGTSTVQTDDAQHIYKTYTVAQDPYYVKIWGGSIIGAIYLPADDCIKGDLSKWKRSLLNVQIAYTKVTAFPPLLPGTFFYCTDVHYADTELNVYTRGDFIGLDYYFARGGYASQAEVDDFFADLNTYYGTHTPTKNVTYRVNGGYYQVTGGDANTDVIGIKAKFTAAGYTATIYCT